MGLPGSNASRVSYVGGRDNMNVDDIDGAIPRRLVGVTIL
jgi:hypothetical protein